MTLKVRDRPIRFINAGVKAPLFSMVAIGLLVWASYGFAQSEAAQEPASATEAISSSTTSSANSQWRSMRPKELLADALVDESHWLDTSEGRILALYRRTEAKVTKGALLLLHAAEDPLVWPPALENLRKNLPRHGWETLAISLPQKYLQTALLRDEVASAETDEDESDEPPTEEPTASSANNSPASAEPTPVREEVIKAYLLAALGFLNEKGQFNLVILVDNSSLYWCMQLLSPSIKTNRADPNTVDGPLQALVIANLQPQEPLSVQELEASLNQPQLPVLDIFFAPDDMEQKAQRHLHKAIALRNKLDFYQQVSIEQQPKIIEADAASFLLGRVRGFMEKKAKGTEVKIREEKKSP